MEHKDCVHEMLADMYEADRANPGTPDEEATIDQLCALFMDTMRENNHGVVSGAAIEGAMLGARMLWLRTLGLIAQGDVAEDFGHLLQHLVAELGLVLARAYKAESSTVTDLEALWSL